MIDLLNFISELLGVIYLTVYAAGIYFFRRLNSFTLTFTLVLISYFTQKLIDIPLFNLVSELRQSEDSVIQFNGLLYWYGTWALAECLTVVAILQVHKYLKIPTSDISRKISLVYLSLCIVQVVRYFDRLIELQLFSNLYQVAVPTLNISVAVFFTTYLLQQIWWRHHYGHAN